MAVYETASMSDLLMGFMSLAVLLGFCGVLMVVFIYSVFFVVFQYRGSCFVVCLWLFKQLAGFMACIE